MSLRRLLAASPLALLIAMAAHVAGFGSSHMLGGVAGPNVLGLALACTALLALSALLLAALRAPAPGSAGSAAAELADLLPGRGRPAGLAASLAAGAYACFVALEAIEGHGPAGSLQCGAIIVPLAAAITLFVRLCLAWIANAGVMLAAYAGRAAAALAPPERLAFAPVRIAHGVAPHSRRRGRAPPSRA